jgi:hypothetical protein
MSFIRVAQSLILEHYRGGCPVPRAPFLYNGGLIYIYQHVVNRVRSLARPLALKLNFFLTQQNRLYG